MRSDFVFDDLASGYRTRGWATRAAGYRAAISCVGTFRTHAAGPMMSVYGRRADLANADGDYRK
jgi:hypothetical protein